ncbi:GNAT family N-acetyltransferase [Kocuria palustris]|uniref:GNAT family N-acetyltransferase n=1 Tax=Kocuria palustris TaxID=71999 RepID=UPI0021B30608|nr:GNAT family N-acetyltransferase [Kocuria palustris]
MSGSASEPVAGADVVLSGPGWRVHRDPHGVPHVQAESIAALAEGHGAITAVDRAWDLEVLRTRAEARSAALLGPAHDDADELTAALGVQETARTWYEAASPEDQRFLAAYARGVDGQLDAWARSPEARALGLTGRRPEPWRPWTPIAVHLDAHLLAGSLPEQLWRRHVRRTLGQEWVAVLDAESPRSAASNAWLVPGPLSVSGAPMIAADPHRVVEGSGPYQPVCLSAPGLRVRGLALVGLPGVPHFGRTDTAAWAITAAMAVTAEVADVPVTRRGGVLVEVGSGAPIEITREPRAVEGTRELRRSSAGPLLPVSDPARLRLASLADGERMDLVAVRLAAPSDPSRALAACRELLRARTADDAAAAWRGWAVPVNDVIAADADGACRHLTAGAAAGPLPPVRAPEDLLIRANQRDDGPGGMRSIGCAPAHRARRAEDLLRGALRRHGRITHDDLLAAQLDTHSASLLGLVRGLLNGPGALDGAEDPAAAALRRRLLSWDGRMDPDSPTAAAAACWRDHLARRIARHPLLAPLQRDTELSPLWAPMLGPAGRIGLALESIASRGPGLGLDPVPAALEALALAAAELDGRPDAATWGQAHSFVPFRAHPGLPRPAAVAVGGDADAILATGLLPGLGAGCVRVPAARVLWDLADPAASLWITPDPVDRGRLGSRPVRRWARGEIDQALPWVAPGRPARTSGRAALGPLPGAPDHAVSLRRVEPVADAPVIHGWVSAERARFWGMTDCTAQQIAAIYTAIDAAATHHAFVVELDGRPAGLVQTYEPHADPIGGAYLPEPGDLGIHVLLAPAERPVPGLTGALAAVILPFLLGDPATRRIVAEPDARNRPALQRLARTGFELGPQIRLPHKTGLLAFLPREAAERRTAGG